MMTQVETSERTCPSEPISHASLPRCSPTVAIDLTPSEQAKGDILMLHGLSGTPDELRGLACTLCERGYRTLGPILHGHARTLQDLGRVSLTSWLHQAEQSLLALSSPQPTPQRRPTFVLGLSFGALLALWLLRRYPQQIAGVVLLSPPLYLRSPGNEWLHQVLKLLPECLLPLCGTRRKTLRPAGYLLSPHNAHPRHSIAAAERALRLRDDLIRSPPLRNAPVLAAYDPNDHLVDVESSSEWLTGHFSNLAIVELPGGQHELPLGPAAVQVETAVQEFLNRIHAGAR